MMCYYALGGIVTMIVFMAAETRWPCPRFEHSFPGGKAYRSGLVWVAGVCYGLIWPMYWLTAFPDLIHTRNGRLTCGSSSNGSSSSSSSSTSGAGETRNATPSG